MSKQQRETRVARRAPQSIEVRKNADGTRTVEGYCVVFAPARSEDMGNWREQIDSRAFDDYLSTNPDILYLFGHDMNRPLARTKSGTLTVTKDSKGLKIRATLPNTQDANDLAELIGQGTIDAQSFGFITLKDDWRQLGDGTLLRTVLEAEMLEASAVSLPAYKATTLGLRGIPAQYRHLIRDAGSADMDVTDPDYSGDTDDTSDLFNPCDDCGDLCSRCASLRSKRTAVGLDGLPARGGVCTRCYRNALCDRCALRYEEQYMNSVDEDNPDARSRRMQAASLLRQAAQG